MPPLNLFYAEPDPDRWLPLDRYPRRFVRRIVRGRPSIGGQRRVFVNLCAGLDRLGVPYRVNAYGHARRNPGEVACIIGKPFLLDRVLWPNPILFGAATFSHPVDDPTVFERLPVKRLLVPGEWSRRMFAEYYGDRVFAWPVGIDVDNWAPAPSAAKDFDVLVYDKIRWDRPRLVPSLLDPVMDALRASGQRVVVLSYGHYREEEFHQLLRRAHSMVFLCEHETQGIAYQQALACGVPLIAWDRGGEWRDPSYHPDRVRFGPVTSVPYWDSRCGVRFERASDFAGAFSDFVNRRRSGEFDPRSYVLERLTLERCAAEYVEHAAAVANDAAACAAPGAAGSRHADRSSPRREFSA